MRQRKSPDGGSIPPHPAGSEKYDLSWSDEQKAWFWDVFRKDRFGFLFYFGCFFVGIYYFPDDGVEINHMDWEAREIVTVSLSILAAVTAVVSLYMSLFLVIPPAKSDVKWTYLKDNWNGVFGYLTTNILVAQMYYWPLCAFAETLRYYGYGSDSVIVRRLIHFVYSLSVWSGSFGMVLTILFLKFCWFEPKWRTTVLEVLQQRGHKYVGPKNLFVHVNQLFIAFLDILVIKDRELLLKWTPSFKLIVLVNLLISITYVASIHLNRYYSGHVPYPFLNVVLKSWKSELIFILFVAFLIASCSAQLYFLANLKVTNIF